MTSPIALRDWAVTIDALGTGEQILLLRKGGIHEETRHFEIQSDQFFLYPAYEHQKRELLKPMYQERLSSLVPKTITLNYFAHLVEDIQITDEERLLQLHPYHIWNHQFAIQRLKWKQHMPLHVLLIRVFKLDTPLVIEKSDQYTGCKSWIQLPPEVNGKAMHPVLSDEAFSNQLQQIKESLHEGTYSSRSL